MFNLATAEILRENASHLKVVPPHMTLPDSVIPYQHRLLVSVKRVVYSRPQMHVQSNATLSLCRIGSLFHVWGVRCVSTKRVRKSSKLIDARRGANANRRPCDLVSRGCLCKYSRWRIICS